MPEPQPEGRPRVVLAEDADAERATLRSLLEGEGVDVVAEATNGADAVELARDLEPDVVLMDLRMPVLGGIEATRLIAERDRFTQVIILTAYDGPLPTRSAEEVGAYAYLVKGCSISFLRDVVFQAWMLGRGLRARDRDEEEGVGRAG